MQTVSNEYAESMKSPLRERGYLQVDISFVNADTKNNAVVTGTTLASFSKKSTVVSAPLLTRSTYTALEPNLIPADGSFYFPPDSGTGVDTGITAADVDTATTINITFGDKVITNVKGFQIDFGKYYATNATIQFSYTPSSDSETPSSQTFTLTDGTSQIWKIEQDIDKFNSVTLTVNSLVETGHRVRILSIIFGFIQSFDNSCITEATLTASQSPVSETLPQTDFDMTIMDTEGLFNPESDFNLCDILGEAMYSIIKYGYQLPSGTIEWVTPYTLYLNSWEYTDGEATLHFCDGLRLLTLDVDESKWKHNAGDDDLAGYFSNLYYIPMMVAASFKETSNYPNIETTFKCSSSLKDYWFPYPYAVSGSIKENVQKVANAAHSLMFITRDDVVAIAPYTDTTPVMTLDKDTLLSKPRADMDSLMKSVTVDYNYWVYKVSEQAKSVYTHTIESTDVGNLAITFDNYVKSLISIKIGDTTISTDDTTHSPYFYHWGLNITIIEDDVGKTLAVRGLPIDAVEKSYALSVGSNGNDLKWSNPLVEDTDVEKFAEWLSTWKRGCTYSYDYRGNPELDCGDIITQQITDTYSITGVIEELTLSFNGAFSGTLKLRKI